ncbi:Transposon Ty3-G Gag-Pol polyprotein [Sesamum angolense]|uniref:Transposon Ty3-G Gag-Pol polyprotein n=1 Tax=Sesamum angolense TaxID=2727404 RepID=A0AAE1WBK8_9LAMI|nr:Transposon Ty3-G Gag-Pol polyprotein [Sesamum angolense]
MTLNVAPIKLKSTAKDNVAPKNNAPYERQQRKLTLKEMQAREYPFLDSFVPGIFDDLLKANLIDLPEMKRPEEAELKDDPKYCKYHHLVGHAIQDCFVFKDKVMQLARQGKIALEENFAATNAITIESGHIDGNKDSYLLLGSKPNNRHLFVAGYVREQKVNRILIDGGSAVNILPLRILKELGIPIDELSNSRLMIQDFNQGEQRAVGVIRMQLTMEDMVSSALFHVIDAKTSCNMLLGRPWLHENTVVPSTWHQYFKYYHNGIVKKKVLGDNKPFTEAGLHFADAKYYIEDATKGKEINLKQPSKLPLKGFDPSTQEEEGGHDALAIDDKKFDLKAFKLLIKAGYNPKEKLNLGKLSPEATSKKLQGLNTTQILLKEKGHAIQDSRVGLGFTPPKPVRIAIKRVNNNYVSKGFPSTEDHKREGNLRESVFNRLGPHRKELHGIANRQSVFDRLGPCKRVGHQKKCAFMVAARPKKNIKSSHTQKLRSLIPSRMKSQTTLTVSCARVLKATAQTVIFTQVQSDDEDDKESAASSNYISNGGEEDIAQTYHITLIEDGEVEEEEAEDAPTELEEGEVNKLIEVSFIQEIKYPMWISNIVLVRKKNGQIRVCIDFRNLNNACSKGDFLLPITELMIDATCQALSFMDGLSGYNQIRMAPADEELTVFRTPKGIYCYKIMPFGLNNAGATYQRAMQRIFDDMLHKNVDATLMTWWLARWYLQLQQFEITYIPQNAVKGKVLADFQADHPMPAEWELSDDLPDEDVLVIEVTPPWKMYFDRASYK